VITVQRALAIVRAWPGVSDWFPPGGKRTIKKEYRFELEGPAPKQLAISLDPTTRDGVSIYVNEHDVNDIPAPRGFFGRDGIIELKRYPKGYEGIEGNAGISRAVIPAPTLNPKENEVVYLAIQHEDALSSLLKWYSGATTSEVSDDGALEQAIDSAKKRVTAATLSLCELSKPGEGSRHSERNC
jgi:hypothetical protein